MPDIKGTTRAMTLFLRTFRTSPTGPAPADWPSPAIMRKWLRRPGFRRALTSVRETLRFQSDFQVSNAATRAARKLCADDADLSTHDLGRLLRLSHLRHRFANHDHADPDATATQAMPRDDDNDDAPEADGLT